MVKTANATFKKFLASNKIGGVLLLLCVAIALFIANSSLANGFDHFLNQQIGFATNYVDLNYNLLTWINDGLMAIFFLLVGLEIKRELWEGELSNLKKASLPVMAALGGMIVPAAIYFLINKGQSTASGWGIPMATDIAFALAILSLLGKNVPSSVKIFLSALAIVDDLGAIMVIAIFYTNQIHWDYLLYAGLIFGFLIVMNYLKIASLYLYVILGLVLWYFVHHSGIHATIAGVLLAFSIPIKTKTKGSLLVKLEHALNIPVNLLIMPLFALANTNITFQKQMLDGVFSPLSLGIFLGLLIGKPLGITLFSAIAVKIKLAKLPSLATWKHILGAGILGGIGFTMSIFISLLSFDNQEYMIQAKFTILCTSVIAGLLGFIYLKKTNSKYNNKTQ